MISIAVVDETSRIACSSTMRTVVRHLEMRDPHDMAELVKGVDESDGGCNKVNMISIAAAYTLPLFPFPVCSTSTVAV
jgi:hypothetical protein